jgi:glycosyltransferase involved in cell wall biosynthesis
MRGNTSVRAGFTPCVSLKSHAKIPRSETRYYKERLQPIIDGEQVKLVGELDDAGKGDLLRGASALLFPIDWPEPFGLVMIEAMACGTPVIAFRRGSVPEVIDEGVTGFIVRQRERSHCSHQTHWRVGQAACACDVRAALYRQKNGRGLYSPLWRSASG